ncbi:hypothetical protein ABIE58_001114 [Roseovarius sp. MBR-78]|jgi:hypothetical protein|uniref:hypothetical protein n=1 Tax=Roseovarius sp. MBR-78 TaxID=3156460 RepID=UPI0033920789
MKHARDLSGELPVAAMAGMEPLAALVIAALRGWNRGGAGAALGVLRGRMSEAQAAAAMAAMCDLAGILGVSRRRALACHAPHCPCVGADEAAFARFVRAAALGEREDALWLASLMVEGHAILCLTDAASRFGLHLHRATLCAAPTMTAACPKGTTVH